MSKISIPDRRVDAKAAKKASPVMCDYAQVFLAFFDKDPAKADCNMDCTIYYCPVLSSGVLRPIVLSRTTGPYRQSQSLSARIVVLWFTQVS